MKVSIIVAKASNGVIGRDGDLPWRISADLKHFKTVTMGKPILMGRKTFESIGKPLPGRLNVVITRDRTYVPPGVAVAFSLEHALATAQRAGAEEAMVVGGAEIYRLALPLAGHLYLTEVHAEVEGDTLFPDFDRAEWTETAHEDHPADGETPAFSFLTLERRG